ncbi:hypothetical protein GCM10011396_37970 [Undibacterium terreum]|uniref:Uncharacterized protein n=1 Tax=Undibacterium terreum TaxID=1224302 RepID=A0A916XMK0_9BURK|nr:hypothetical protein GCM10011396_37970 [Undibacterium terreum]
MGDLGLLMEIAKRLNIYRNTVRRPLCSEIIEPAYTGVNPPAPFIQTPSSFQADSRSRRPYPVKTETQLQASEQRARVN